MSEKSFVILSSLALRLTFVNNLLITYAAQPSEAWIIKHTEKQLEAKQLNSSSSSSWKQNNWKVGWKGACLKILIALNTAWMRNNYTTQSQLNVHCFVARDLQWLACWMHNDVNSFSFIIMHYSIAFSSGCFPVLMVDVKYSILTFYSCCCCCCVFIAQRKLCMRSP